jgi:predicted P-loop ATPase
VTIREWASLYLQNGWGVVPLAHNSKRATQTGWMDLDFTPDDFRETDNIGLRSVGGLVFVDLDAQESVQFADAFLPTTPCVYGRASKPRSKRIFRSVFPKTLAYKDRHDKQVLVEIRSKHQDMAPPSVHPDGEKLEWDGEVGLPAEIDPAALTRAVKLLATASAVARHYAPSGSRHEWALALAGTLRRKGISEEECRTIITSASEWAHDAHTADRLTEIASTYAHDADDPYTGATALADLATGGLVETLTAFWGKGTIATDYVLNTRNRPDRNSISNISIALDKLGVTLTFDTFSKKPFIVYNGYSGLLDDDVTTDLWLDCDRQEQFRPTKDLFVDVLRNKARQNSYHPVLDYLATLTWDKTHRLDSWLIDSADADDSDYTRAVSALILIAAVRRVRNPGCKFDEMMVLESGIQGQFKSTGIKTLCPHPDWFSDDLPLSVPTKELVERTSGKWLIEASDLSGMRHAQVEGLKGMLSRQVDGPVRLAYGRMPVEAPRQFILIGTTNSYTYLSDSTGNRRFWPMRIKRFDIDWIAAHRDQLWAEATQREATGESIRLNPSLYPAAAAQQADRVYDHPWIEAISEEYGERESGVRLTPDDVWTFLAVPVERRNAAGARIIAEAMQTLKYRRISIRTGNLVTRGWGRDT